MNILVAAQNFRQGWGGVPESVRLMAEQLATRGVVVDVFDAGAIHRDVGRLPELPDGSGEAEPFAATMAGDYAAFLQAGPWQQPLQLRHLAQVAPGRRFYLPRGGLGRIEFSRPRDLKKWPYFYGLERRFIARSSGVVFSSRLEQRRTIAGARRVAPEHVIPDFVAPPPPGGLARARRAGAPLTFGFLAEISPRKGLAELVEAFVAWVRANGHEDRARLVVGGTGRAGSEGYLERIYALLDRDGRGVSVEFRGPISHAARSAFYEDVDAFVVASRFESYGLTVCEALSHGCAVVATKEIGVLEYLPAHRRVVVADRASVAALAEALERAHAELRSGPAADMAGFAMTSAEAINARALDAWTRLLGL